LWPWINPFVWFLFYPAVFFCARFDGLRGGVVGAILSIGLVWYFFLPPQLSWKIASVQHLFSAGVFMVMGVLFGLVHVRIRQALASADARFHAAFEQDGIGNSVLGLDGLWRKANQRFGQIVGRRPEDIVGLGLEGLIHPSDLPIFEGLEQSLLGQEAPSLAREVRILRPAGPAIWGRVTLSVRWKANGEPAEFLVSLEDLQDQKEAARVLQEQSRIMRDVQHLARIGSWTMGRDMVWRLWSDETYRILGLDPLSPPLPLDDMTEVLGAEACRQLAGLLRESMTRGAPLAGQIQFEGPGGEQRVLRVHAEPVPGKPGEGISLYGLFQDVTEQARAERALRESEGRMRLLFEHAPASLAMFDREMRYLAVSQRWLDDYHLGRQELLGRSHYEIFPEIPESWREVHRRGLEGETIRAEADRFERLDGSV
ncbi:MAG TPA: PAS domain S-box protein, partial [Holophaga sp.]|nr:PAS domain S-box protein [Holophaga sp.]